MLKIYSFCITLIITINLCRATDLTVKDRATGVDVVDAVIKLIKDSEIFIDDNGFLKRIAYVESRFGKNEDTFRHGYFGGIWQNASDPGPSDEIKNWKLNQPLGGILIDIKAKFGIDFTNFNMFELLKPLYSGLAARILLFLIKDDIPDRFDIKGQGEYWKKHIHPKGSVEQFIKDVNELENRTVTCRGRMDLAIVMDGSGSIHEQNYDLAKEFVAKLFGSFSLDSVQVGFVVFSTDSHVIFPLNSGMSLAQMNKTILDSVYPGGWTNTSLGIKDGVEILGNAKDRSGIPKIMAIFTDGDPTCPDRDLSYSLELARSNNITMFAIGIGSEIKRDNLRRMTNSMSRVFSISSYDSLSKSFQMINSETCKIPQKPVVGSNLTDILVKLEKRFFHFFIPPGGITIKITIHIGRIKGYFSYKHENPSSALNDGEFGNEGYIPSPPKYSGFYAGDNSTSTVYVAVEGQDVKNNYTLKSIEGNHVSGSGFIKINSFAIILSIIFYSISKFFF